MVHLPYFHMPYTPGREGEPLKMQQVYYCVNTVGAQDGKPCVKYRRPVYSWLTAEEAHRLLDPPGLKCAHCGAGLKWIRSEPYWKERPE